MSRASPTGIKVIVIGAGFGGLAAAIECIRQGHEVEIFEQAPEFLPLGDLIVLTPNGTRIVSTWDDVLPKIMHQCLWVDAMEIHRASGELLHKQEWQNSYQGAPFCMGQRSFYQKTLVDFAESLGIKIHLNTRVEEHFETEHKAGIIVDGVRHEADVLIGADGIRSRCRTFVTGQTDDPQGSGYAVFRAWFPLDQVKDPIIDEWKDSGKDEYHLFIGEDLHAFILTCPTLNMAVYAFTHKDTFDAKESYTQIDHVLQASEGWDPRFRAFVKATPEGRLVDWKLLWRDPFRPWVSKGGRVIIAGDAAHPFLPTSGNGAVQAIEDGASIAYVLRRGGRENIPLALRVHEALRYERVTLSQRIGFETRHRFHKTKWEKLAEDPSAVNMPQPAWQYSHDPVQYAAEKLDEAVADVLEGKPLQSTNVAPGHVHKDWTVAELMALGSETID
ncbi:hypothetical protein EDD37DRAFT_658281 [Exophiala viscosa]|uniref:uncharacterized protein n=1 Tax=Exophiala viscosa TaxID=2486360 RepID=UPI00219EA7C4|nr:hypothetical protein EDD37DRAFT_658281 [Exophiala viscosa]